jgi:GT2 family glycosyltransferase
MRLSVSAVIPAFNRERFVGEAIESVLRQARPVDEIIVVDDGSTDGTAQVAASFPGVKLVRLPTTLGTAGARNAAVRAATGDLLAWLDSDDVWLPEHTATVVSLLERHPTCVVAFTSAEYFGKREGLWQLPGVTEDEPFDALAVSFKRTISTMSPSLTRRRAVLAVNGFDESLRCSVDFDLFLRLSLQGPFVCSHRVTTRYRWHGDQISSRPFAQLQAIYFGRTKLLRTLIASDRRDVAEALGQSLLECLRSDLWEAWAAQDAERFGALVTLASGFPRASAVTRPFGRESLRALRRYCHHKGQLQGPGLIGGGAATLLGRPRWLYRRAAVAEMRYRVSRLSKPTNEWLGQFVEAANAWGRLKGAPRNSGVPSQPYSTAER